MRSHDRSLRILTWECHPGPPPLMFESSAQRKDRCFHALPNLEPSQPNTAKPRSASQERSGPLPSRECPNLCLQLTPTTGLSGIRLQVFHHSLPPPGPRSQCPAVTYDAPKPARRTPWHSPMIGSKLLDIYEDSLIKARTFSLSGSLPPESK